MVSRDQNVSINYVSTCDFPPLDHSARSKQSFLPAEWACSTKDMNGIHDHDVPKSSVKAFHDEVVVPGEMMEQIGATLQFQEDITKFPDWHSFRPQQRKAFQGFITGVNQLAR
jgi:hypothetical protein